MKIFAPKTLCLFVSLFAIACGGGGKDDPDPVILPDPDPIPQAVTLLVPTNNSFCVGNDLGSTIQVSFEWSSVSFADHYEVRVYDISGMVILSQTIKNTRAQLVLPKARSFTWNVKAVNTSGESISTTFSNSTPGDAIPNFIPVIKSIDFNEAQNKIIVVVQDNEGDQLFFDARSADNDSFENATIYATNEEVMESGSNQNEHIIEIQNEEWSLNFWFMFSLRDVTGNQTVSIKSQKFN
ncbi:MAG: hypothetical protein ABF273_07520 [Wenyingzhuangia sp.]|uniref:hypothetical protein n=1 Tax=Wenyingzhuangia sp. TaxID=1964193 RepID=UPI003219F387